MFKPMLAGKCTDVSKLRFPVLVSTKLDGIRATVQGGKLMSRTLKPIPNANVQALFTGLPEGLDGELIVGDPREPDAYRKTTSIVMSDDKPADGIQLHIFDRQGSVHGFEKRFNGVRSLGLQTQYEVVIVPHFPVYTAEKLEEYEQQFLAQGYEGLMIRAPQGPYKEGRSTEAEGYLLKLKRFEDGEAKIVGMYEQMHNANDAKKNELGRTARSSAKAGMEATGVLGGFDVVGMGGTYDGVEFSIGGGFDAEMRKDFWGKSSLVGKTVKFKYFASGSKDRPRFPIFLGFRDRRDM